MEPLCTQVRQCRICEAHLPAGPRPVFVVGPQARILVIGQAPGRRVHESGIPWSDASGRRLRQWLGVDEATFYNPAHFGIVPMGLCYPGTGTSGDLPPRPECAPQWHGSLLSLMPQVQLTLLIGQYAQRYYLGADKPKTLAQTVANWESYWPRYLPMPHPSPRNQRWLRQHPWFEDSIVPVLQLRVRALLDTHGCL